MLAGRGAPSQPLTRAHAPTPRPPPAARLSQADARGVPCYVEVTQPALVAAYAALGFEAPEPPKELFGVPVSPMRRLPSAGRKA